MGFLGLRISESELDPIRMVMKQYDDFSRTVARMTSQSIVPIMDSAQEVSRFLNKTCMDLDFIQRSVRNTVFPFIEEAIRSAEVAIRFYQDLVERDKVTAEAIRYLNEKLMERGWIFSPAMPNSIALDLEEIVRSEGVESAIEPMAEYLHGSVDDIFKDILEGIPSDRKPAIRQAIEAYKGGNYYLCTPVFFIEAEGTFIDIFGGYLYTSSFKLQKKPQEVIFIESQRVLVDSFEAYIKKVVAVSVGLKDPVTDNTFGRNPILHGRMKNYGKRDVALRSLLLLHYVIAICGLIE